MKLLVIAKAPLPGSVKTRLSPPCSPERAAAIAEASLEATLDVVALAPADDRVLVLDGEPGPWLPPGFRVIPQRGGGLDERLAAAFEDAGGPALLIGMDSPQVTPGLLELAIRALESPRVDAVLGEATDGGWWAIGLRSAGARVFLGVPMSTPGTARAQRARLVALGMRFAELPRIRDVDRHEDAVEVARRLPGSRFANVVLGAEEVPA
jgi:rSAM/selenodomain-associated transferase 1